MGGNRFKSRHRRPQYVVKSPERQKNQKIVVDSNSGHGYITSVDEEYGVSTPATNRQREGGWFDGKLAHGLAGRFRPGADAQGPRGPAGRPDERRPATGSRVHDHPAPAHVRAGLAG